jgi:hypothetical protein
VLEMRLVQGTYPMAPETGASGIFLQLPKRTRLGLSTCGQWPHGKNLTRHWLSNVAPANEMSELRPQLCRLVACGLRKKALQVRTSKPQSNTVGSLSDVDSRMDSHSNAGTFNFKRVTALASLP